MTSDPNQSAERLDKLIRAFVDSAEAMWTEYKQAGPGRVARAMFDPIGELADELDRVVDDDFRLLVPVDANTDISEVRASIANIRDLAYRCACRSEGLCFVTGEAGLIPRRDLHSSFDEVLQALRDVLRDCSPG